MDGCGKLCSCWIRACTSACVSECIQALCMIRAYPMSAPFLHAGCYCLFMTGRSFLFTCPEKRIKSLFCHWWIMFPFFPLSCSNKAFASKKNIDIRISTSVWWPVWHSEHLALINLASLCGENVSLSLSYFGGLIRFDSLLGEPSSTLILCIPLVVLHLCSRDDDSPVLCCLKNHLPF